QKEALTQIIELFTRNPPLMKIRVEYYLDSDDGDLNLYFMDLKINDESWAIGHGEDDDPNYFDDISQINNCTTLSIDELVTLEDCLYNLLHDGSEGTREPLTITRQEILNFKF